MDLVTLGPWITSVVALIGAIVAIGRLRIESRKTEIDVAQAVAELLDDYRARADTDRQEIAELKAIINRQTREIELLANEVARLRRRDEELTILMQEKDQRIEELETRVRKLLKVSSV
jgi:chromosome segregation ATPase